MNDVNNILEIRHLNKVFRQGGRELVVLKDVSLSARAGDQIGILGTSGSGKSTMLQIAGMLEKPSSGDVIINGHNGWHVSDVKRAYMRQYFVSFVYQFHHLLPEFSALENIMMPLIVRGEAYREAHSRALKLLKALKLERRADHRPAQLSGGEQQRVAILRALVVKPDLLLTDEPTGNLDTNTAGNVFTEMMQLVTEGQSALIMVTHDESLAARMAQRYRLHDGQLTPQAS